MDLEAQHSPLPRGWTWATVGEVTSPRGAKVKPADMPDAPFIGMEHIEPHTMKLLGMGRASDVRSSASYFAPGDILYGRLRPYLNKVHRPEYEGLASGEFIVFPDHPLLHNPYLQYFLNQWEFVSFVTRLNTGDRPRVDFSQFSDHPIPIPPLPEQHRIVAEIEKQFARLDASVAALRRTQANLKRYRSSVLRAACSGELVPTEAVLARAEGREYEPADILLERILAERRARWEAQEKRRGKYKEPAAPETSDLPPLPEGWEWVSFEQLITTLRNGYSKRPEGSDGIPILRISAVRPMNVNTQDMRWVNSTKDLSTFLVNSGDLLFTRYNGNPSLVGVCGVVPRLNQKLLHPDKLIRAVLLQCGTLPEFVQIVANAGQSRVFLSNRVRTTAGQAGISGTDVKQMPIPLPPHAEQQRIVAEVERRLSVIQQAAAAVEASLQRAERLRQSILKQAFSGELVPQDPDDEPASVLLERIRAQREAEQAAASVTKKRPARRRRAKATAQQLSLEEATA